ncbi:ComEC/Rec2 family competence protein [Chitinophaga pinensis]|nr:ComEC/Rec2 family competence protein [Chitinophaga pinensis]
MSLRLPLISAVMASAGLLLFISSRWPASLRYRYDWCRGIALQWLVAAGGCVLVLLSDVRYHGYYFERSIRPGDLLQVRLEEPVQAKKKTLKTIAAIRYVISGNTRVPAKGRLLIYLQIDSNAMQLRQGDQLLINSNTVPVSRSGNPGAFDYRRYCAWQQIYRQAYLQSSAWQLLHEQDECFVRRWLRESRIYCLQTLQQYIGGREAALAAALLIGYRYELDVDMVQDYTNTGIVHIIAISGMHLAMIYGALLWLLSWWPAHRFSDVTKGTLIIVLLWAFTLLTGGAASVLRATVMFTFLTLGRFMLERHTNVYNTLAASAFLLLCYEPRLLLDVGFQLSYLAVLSIVVAYRRLYYQWQFDNKWMNKCWDMTALTLAAQLFTLPVSLYYFHQFPLYFLPANMIAVPLSTVVLYGEIVLLITGRIPVIADVIGPLLKIIMQCMNTLVAQIGHWPGALIADMHIHLFSVLCLYACIGGLLLWIIHHRRQGLQLTLIAMTCWTTGEMFLRLNEQHQHKMVVYNIPGHTVVEMVNGHRIYSVAGEVMADALYDRYLKPAHVVYGATYRGMVNTCVEACTFPGFRVLAVGNKRLVVVDSVLPEMHPEKKLRTDYLLLSHNPHVDIRQLEQIFDADCYIFDASNTLRNIQQWKSDCYVLTLRFFSVPDQGAYVVNF